ncbi:MAG: hypothetical protein ACO29O_06875 [Chitinophagaceae bacterium]
MIRLLGFLFSFMVCLQTEGREFLAAGKDTSDVNSLLFHGVEYIKDLSNIKGNPLFPSDKYRGSVKYHGNWYRDIEITYDCEDELVIIRDMHDLLRLQLINEKLEEFYIDEHHFVKTNVNEEGNKFYELIFKGKRTFLVKWTKTKSVDAKSDDTYILQRAFWVIEKGVFLNISQKNEVFLLANKHKGEVKRAVGKLNIKYKKEPVKYISAALKIMEDKGW